jgi:hypothetical protein
MGGQKGCQGQFQAVCKLLKDKDLLDLPLCLWIRLMFALTMPARCVIPFDCGK